MVSDNYRVDYEQRIRSARFRFNVDGSVVWLGPTTRMQFKVEPVKV